MPKTKLNKETKLIVSKAAWLEAQLNDFKQFIGSIDRETFDKDELTVRLEDVKPIKKEYTDLLVQLDDDLIEDSDLTSLGEFHTEYIRALAKASSLLTPHRDENPEIFRGTSFSRNSNNSNRTNNGNHFHLPKIPLPQFDGDLTNYVSFRDSFQSMIDNNPELNDIDKFNYLKGCLKGSAAQVIANLPHTNENYKVALELLEKRYENPKLIIQGHIQNIFNLTPMTRESASELHQLCDTLNKNLRALELLHVDVDKCSPFICHIILTKLDAKTRNSFTTLKAREVPSIKEIDTFLTQRCQALDEQESAGNQHKKPNFVGISKQGTYAKRDHTQSKQVSYMSTNSNVSCPLCSESHYINLCEKFQKMSPTERLENVQNSGTCSNCLRHSSSKSCYSKFKCRVCQKRHHTMLHKPNENSKVSGPETEKSKDNTPTENQTKIVSTSTLNTHSVTSCPPGKVKQVLLSTAVVKVKGKTGKLYSARCLLDSGSQTNFISSELCDTLALPKNKLNLTIMGVNSSSSKVRDGVDIEVHSLYGDCHFNMSCLVISKITESLPIQTFDKDILPIPSHLDLADENFNESSDVDLLIGASHFYNLLVPGQLSLGMGQPILQNTSFGWIISGNLSFHDTKLSGAVSNVVLAHQCCENQASLQDSLIRFFSVEEVSPKDPMSKLSKDEQFCESHFLNTVEKSSDNRYIVSIPFNEKVSQLGNSQNSALKRFLQLEKRLDKNPPVKTEYTKFMTEYVELQHMTKISSEEVEGKPHFYLPHHEVLKTDSLTTKLRVVFDGSAKSDTGVSLNETQTVGPVIQSDLFSILLRFRQHQIALVADIEKMYRQILVKEEQRPFQLIYWRNDPSEEISTYQLNTITYGTSSASFLATRCLQHLSDENSKQYPKASSIIKEDFYMDDLLTGADTFSEIEKIKSELTEILASSGFPMRKFLSNNSHLLTPDGVSEQSLVNIPVGERKSSKTLGIHWNAIDDVFYYDVTTPESNSEPTKRSILSSIAQLFDPLGLLTPVIIKVKVLLQKIWKLGLSWDEPIPTGLIREWERFCDELRASQLIQIPRCFILSQSIRNELIGFCDASEAAYGACMYLKSVQSSQNVEVKLLCSKSKVAPLRGTTMPRLELSAAVLLAQLLQRVRQTISIEIHEVHLLSDSTIVLAWIKATPNKYKTFVANRIAAIQELTEVENWAHVRSQKNPADLLSRGLDASDLINNDLWWHGPPFLLQKSSECPKIDTPSSCDIVSNEVKLSHLAHVNSTRKSNVEPFYMFSKHSSFFKLKRSFAYILRFLNNCRKVNIRYVGNLSTSELNCSEKSLIRICQRESFSVEIDALSEGDDINNSSLLNLNPFIDEDKLLRVGGRIKHSDYPHDKKHPILLPKVHPLTSLILKHYHESLLHCGAQQLLYSVREKFWPVAGKVAANKIVRDCVKCFKVNPKSGNPLMGDLPEARMEHNQFAFYNTGVDFAGPIMMKDRKTRNSKLLKVYLSLFICMTTKAVHIEVVTSLSSEAFIAVLKRFVARRGKPNQMFSDNATNFTATAHKLRELHKVFSSNSMQNSISEYLASNDIKWKFIPPHSPHFGGIWESNIKRVKFHLRRILGNSLLDYEDLQTITVQIEAILNSRPLSPLTSHPEDFQPLTPGHFLIGRPLVAVPEAALTEQRSNRLRQFQRLQQLTCHFWKRWSREVVPDLQRRQKWMKNLPELAKVGSLVLLRDENLPPLKWALARITDVHPGKDKVIRAVTVRLPNGYVTKRAVHKLCVLPNQD